MNEIYIKTWRWIRNVYLRTTQSSFFFVGVTLACLIMVNATGNGTETSPIKLTEKDSCFFYRMIAPDRLSKNVTALLYTYSTFSLFNLSSASWSFSLSHIVKSTNESELYNFRLIDYNDYARFTRLFSCLLREIMVHKFYQTCYRHPHPVEFLYNFVRAEGTHR